jgi:hypothetical protein
LEEGPYEDDDGVQHDGCPRWQALEQIVKAKEAAEGKQREAACTKPVAKRTRKPKR